VGLAYAAVPAHRPKNQTPAQTKAGSIQRTGGFILSAIITPQQMVEYMVEVLNNAVKDYPEEEQEAAKVKILDAFSAAMFKGPKEKK